MTILCYHDVRPGWAAPLAVDPTTFAEQCEWLARHRAVLPLDEAVTRLDRSGRLPRGTTALTFDDGLSGLYEHAFPVLTRLELPATVFLVAQTLTPAGQQVDWVDTPPDFPLGTLTAEQVVEMHAAGLGFGSHSLAHRDLTTLTEEACAADLRRSREVLEELLGTAVRFLAYPRGRHNPAVRAAAQRAGFSHAFTLPEVREPVGRYAVPRVGIYHGNTVRDLRVKSLRPYLPLRTGAARGLATLARRRRHLIGGRGR
jgi:peptidoglycan/xylan/chitin deacetylase (PgdA/CDA1 family)